MKVGTGSQLWFLVEPLRLELQPDLPAVAACVCAALVAAALMVDDDGVVEVGVDFPQVPIALFSEIGLPRQEGAPMQARSFLPEDSCDTNLDLAPSPAGELVESFVVKLPTMDPPAPSSSGRKGRSRVHARSALTTGLRGPNPKKQLDTQQGKKHSEPETGTLINPSPVGERKPCFCDGH